MGYNGDRCFYLVEVPQQRYLAAVACTNPFTYGGYLAGITDQDESNFITMKLQEKFGGAPFSRTMDNGAGQAGGRSLVGPTGMLESQVVQETAWSSGNGPQKTF